MKDAKKKDAPSEGNRGKNKPSRRSGLRKKPPKAKAGSVAKVPPLPKAAANDPLAAAVLEQLQEAKDGKSLSFKQIVGRGKLDAEEERAFKLLTQLVEAGTVEQVEGDRYRLPSKDKTYVGTLELPRGEDFGLVHVPKLKEPIIVPEQKNIRAFDGDQVRVVLRAKGQKGQYGAVVGVEEFARKEFVGYLELGGRRTFFIPQEKKIKTDFKISSKDTGDAKDGDKVVVRVFRWEGSHPEAVVTRVLGKTGDHKAEMHSIILEYGIETDFPEQVQAEADALPGSIPQSEIDKRRDMRTIRTCTIDPADAKDFDDALSFQALDNGNYEVGIHIADVSHFVRPGSELEKEAYNRATSVYLVDRTIPMLPERISNDLCSLRPHEDRLAFSAIFELTPTGQIENEWFGRTVIHSQRRFTYEEAQEVIETGAGDFATELNVLNKLAYQLRDRRFAEGSLSFETDEVRFRLDEEGVPQEVYIKARFDAHKLVEDFMLLANRRVAKFVAHFRKQPPIPFPYRIHPPPEGKKLDDLANFLSAWGYKINTTSEETIKRSINRLALETEGKPEANIIQQMCIRSMSKAIYTTTNIGHFGLGFTYYGHFTSPIRRYPDVLCHRVLQACLDGSPMKGANVMEEACTHSSEREKRAADAERASIKYKQVEYLGARLGELHEGMVSGVMDFGIFVELEGNKCEGLLPLRDMKDDHYVYDEKKFQVVGKRTGRSFRMGDRLRVRIKKINLQKRNADFELA